MSAGTLACFQAALLDCAGRDYPQNFAPQKLEQSHTSRPSKREGTYKCDASCAKRKLRATRIPGLPCMRNHPLLLDCPWTPNVQRIGRGRTRSTIPSFSPWGIHHSLQNAPYEKHHFPSSCGKRGTCAVASRNDAAFLSSGGRLMDSGW